MVEATQARPDQLVSYYDDESSRLIAEWTATEQPIGLYTVVEVPNGHLRDNLRAFRLEHLVSTLAYANDLHQKGTIIPEIHITSPSSIALPPDPENAAEPTNAQLLRAALDQLKESDYPELRSTQLVVDTGNPLSQEVRDNLYVHASRIIEERPHIVPVSAALFAKNYHGIVDTPVDPVTPVMDLLARTQAWGFGNGSPLLTPRTNNSISYVPPHVSPQIKLMASIGRGYPGNPDSQIATVIASQHNTFNSWRLWRIL